VAVLKTRTLLDWLALAVRVLTRRRRRDPQMEYFRARRVEVRCDRPQPVERDGEPAEPTTELVVEVVPGALTLCVPAQEERQ
jgi:diacylglycerol kinase (ATP)